MTFILEVRLLRMGNDWSGVASWRSVASEAMNMKSSWNLGPNVSFSRLVCGRYLWYQFA